MNYTEKLICEYNVRARAAGKRTIKSCRNKELLRRRIRALPQVEPKTISEFMRFHGINPKIGRAKLRDSGYHAPYDVNDGEIRRICSSLSKT